MVSFRGKKRTWAAPTSVSFSGFNSKFPTSIPTPFICGVSPPPGHVTCHSIPNSARAGYEASVSYP